MKIGRSSDETGGRGNGLATMKELVDNATGQSSLHILSRKGKYVSAIPANFLGSHISGNFDVRTGDSV